MVVLRSYVFCLLSGMSQYMANIYGFNLWSAPSFNFWSRVVDVTLKGPPMFGEARGGAYILDSTSNSLYVVC